MQLQEPIPNRRKLPEKARPGSERTTPCHASSGVLLVLAAPKRFLEARQNKQSDWSTNCFQLGFISSPSPTTTERFHAMRLSFLTTSLVVLLHLLPIRATAQEASDIEIGQAFQICLLALGYDPGPIDGNLGIQTMFALVSYQQDRGLTVSGDPSEETIQAMLSDLDVFSGAASNTSTWDSHAGSDFLPTEGPSSGSIVQVPSPRMPSTSGTGSPILIGEENNYLGMLSSNPYAPNSVSNPYGMYGSPYSPYSISNPYGEYGSQYSPNGAANPYATGGARIYGSDGTYLGRLNSNRYDPESVSNPYGQYGSRYSPTSINNPYSLYGNPYSSRSVANPFGTPTLPSLPSRGW